MNQIRAIVPVADRVLPGGRSDAASPARLTANAPERPVVPPWLLTLLLAMVFYSFNIMLTQGGPLLAKFGVYLRYLVWPTIAVALVLHLVRARIDEIFRTIAIVLPFFAIGVMSGLLSLDPIGAGRVLTFWIFGVIGAALIGNDLDHDRLFRTLFWMNVVLFVVSLVLIFALPAVGRLQDLRSAGGAWRGTLPGKNQFGFLAVYAIILTNYTRGLAWPLRWAMIALAGICVIGSESGGDVLQAVAAVAFMIAIRIVWRLPLSTTLRTGLIFTVVFGAIGMIAMFSSVALGAIGRDATLTGRTDIWPAYFERALEYWPTGAGPGTFTQDSFITIDVGSRFSALGDIRTPHNMFIATFGEVGLFGLIAFLLPFFYFAFVLPFRNRAPSAKACGVIAFTTMIGGLSETREVFGTGFGMFLLIMMYAAARKEGKKLGDPTPRLKADPPNSGVPVLG